MRLAALPRWGRRVRFRLRTIMILIAILAVGMYAKLNYDLCVKKADSCEVKARLYRAKVAFFRRWLAMPEAHDQQISEFGLDRVRVEVAQMYDYAWRLDEAEAAFRRAACLFFLPRPTEPEELRGKLYGGVIP